MLLLFGTFMILICIGVPIAFCLIGSSLVWMVANGYPLMMVCQRMAAGVNKFSLLSMVFFSTSSWTQGPDSEGSMISGYPTMI